jgi:hypothetical protein
MGGRVGPALEARARFPVQLSSVGYPDVADPFTPGDSPTPNEELDDEHHAQLAEELAAMQEQLAQTPASVVIANHAIGLFQLAAIHLNRRPPNLAEGRLAIDAFSGLVEATKGRLGDEEEALRDALVQIRLAFVSLSRADDGSGDGNDEAAAVEDRTDDDATVSGDGD